jgi:hypothetical protein
MRGNIDKDVCHVCKKEEGGSHILQCGYKGLEGQMVGKKVYKCTSRDRN